MPKQLSKGAEAVIYKDGDTVVKDRVTKNYRCVEIDSRLRKSRTRREAKILERLTSLGFHSPTLIKSDDKEMKITMTYIDGPKVRDVLNHKTAKHLCAEIGEGIAFLHKNDIMHADLTTSNMILDSKTNKVRFIDFGLSFFSEKIEDRAVDIHLLRQALESKHSEIWGECFKYAVEAYKKHYVLGEDVLKRLIIVEKRGRYKH